MDKGKVQNEISLLLGDVKEQILYLEELGVEQLAAEIPEYKARAEANTSPAKVIGSTKRLEKFIPEQNDLKVPDILIEKPDTPRRNREGIFDSLKLSNLPLARRPISKEVPSISIQPPEKIAAPEPAVNENEMKESIPADVPAILPESSETLEQIRNEIGKDCSRCQLCEERTQVVNSVGDPNADLMFIGEAPGADEDEQGEPFVGRAGKLLTKIIGAIQLKREDVFIGNINRCRPPGNRQPQAEEAEICRPFLLREIAVVRPKVIVVMGNTACHNLLDTKIGITKLRGSFKDYFGVKVMPTFHPAYLLRDPRKKREVWEDMKTVRDYLNSVK